MRRSPVTSAALAALVLLPVAGASGVTLAPWAAAAVGALTGAVGAAVAVRGVRRDPPLLALLALLGWGVAVGVGRGVEVAPAGWTLAGGAVAAVGAAAAQRPRGQVGARWGVVLAGTAAALHLVVERLLEGGRPGGPFAQPVLAATLAVLALALLPALPLSAALRACGGVVLLAGVLASGSRAAMLATAVLAAWWGFGRMPRAVRLAMAALGGVAALGLAARVVGDRDPLRWERLRIWGVAVRTAWAEAPWGAGPGGWADVALPHNFPREGELTRWHREPSLAESDFLQLAGSLGVVGVGLGVAVAVLVLPRCTRAGLGVALALGVTSAVNTQLPVPAVAIAAGLALAGTLRRPRHVKLWRATPAQAWAGGAVLAAVAGVALSWPRPGLAVDAQGLAAQAVQLAATDPAAALARAEQAVARRPRWGEGQRLLGSLYLRWGTQRREAALLERAAQAFARARQLNPNDALAAYGEAESAALIGERRRAAALAREAVRLEPNFARAWLLLASLEVAEGQVEGACRAWGRALAARRAAEGTVMISGWEREVARWDRGRAALVSGLCGGEP